MAFLLLEEDVIMLLTNLLLWLLTISLFPPALNQLRRYTYLVVQPPILLASVASTLWSGVRLLQFPLVWEHLGPYVQQ